MKQYISIILKLKDYLCLTECFICKKNIFIHMLRNCYQNFTNNHIKKCLLPSKTRYSDSHEQCRSEEYARMAQSVIIGRYQLLTGVTVPWCKPLFSSAQFQVIRRQFRLHPNHFFAGTVKPCLSSADMVDHGFSFVQK